MCTRRQYVWICVGKYLYYALFSYEQFEYWMWLDVSANLQIVYILPVYLPLCAIYDRCANNRKYIIWYGVEFHVTEPMSDSIDPAPIEQPRSVKRSARKTSAVKAH